MASLISFVFIFCLCILLSFSETIMSPNNIFILGGQSNMAGRGGVFWDTTIGGWKWDGFIPPESQSKSSILRFTVESKWESAHEPLHWDVDHKKTNGVGPGMAFANELLTRAGNKAGIIGLVPCAIGGTHLREWMKGTVNYTNLVNRIIASEKNGGKIQAFFWFQGESDAAVKVDSDSYETNLTKFFNDLRADLHRPPLPIILVKIANWDFHVSPVINFTDEVRMAEEAVKKKLPKINIIDAREAIKRAQSHNRPDFNPDGHMSVYSEVEVGKMLAEAYLKGFS